MNPMFTFAAAGSIQTVIAILSISAAAIIITLVAQKIIRRWKKGKPRTEVYSESNQFDVFSGYSSKWLFSYNEKEAFYQIKSVTDKLGLHLLAKVRLYDLLEPQKGTGKYKTLQYKIQAKHVDFVVCDQKLVARAVIELDDSSHNIAARKERDEFVDKVLTNCGYNVLRYKTINTELLEAELSVYNPAIKYV